MVNTQQLLRRSAMALLVGAGLSLGAPSARADWTTEPLGAGSCSCPGDATFVDASTCTQYVRNPGPFCEDGIVPPSLQTTGCYTQEGYYNTFPASCTYSGGGGGANRYDTGPTPQDQDSDD